MVFWRGDEREGARRDNKERHNEVEFTHHDPDPIIKATTYEGGRGVKSVCSRHAKPWIDAGLQMLCTMLYRCTACRPGAAAVPY